MVALVAAPAAAQTYVTEDITTDTWWTPAGSPYIVQTDVTITDDSTLTIQSVISAGVTVTFDENCRLETEWGSAMVAEGAPVHPVLFTSSLSSPARGDWKWVEVGGPGASRFDRCVFEYAEHGLRVSASSPTVTHCTIRDCSSSGLFCGSASPVVQYCDIHGNRDGIGISAGGQPSSPVINFNNIYDNSNWNVWTLNCPEPHTVVNAEQNWWGSSDEAYIAQEIRDSNDDPDLHITIDYDPWWTEQPVEKASWARVKALFD
jgi:hypothetical protein